MRYLLLALCLTACDRDGFTCGGYKNIRVQVCKTPLEGYQRGQTRCEEESKRECVELVYK